MFNFSITSLVIGLILGLGIGIVLGRSFTIKETGLVLMGLGGGIISLLALSGVIVFAWQVGGGTSIFSLWAYALCGVALVDIFDQWLPAKMRRPRIDEKIASVCGSVVWAGAAMLAVLHFCPWLDNTSRWAICYATAALLFPTVTAIDSIQYTRCWRLSRRRLNRRWRLTPVTFVLA